MPTTEDLVSRNAVFSAADFSADFAHNAWGTVTVIGCVDSRVDPAQVLGLELGEASIIRDVGGRVTPSTLRTMAMLARVERVGIDTVVPGPRTLIVLHHTDCSMIPLAAFPDLLTELFEIPTGQLDTKSLRDPFGSVRVDVDLLRAHQHEANTLVSGLVYDVHTGRVEVAVAPMLLDRE
jgi:carbonic anhydrase